MHEDYDFARRVLWVFWPAFLVAGVAEMIVFSSVDPSELTLFGQPVDLARETVYALGFFLFWAIGAASSALTVFLSRSPVQENRCPLPPHARPAGCPKQEDAIGASACEPDPG
jgi:hypothetical protein